MLPAEPKRLRQLAVSLKVGALQVVQKAATPTNEHEEPAAGMVILLVCAQVIGELINPLGQLRNLHLGRSGIRLMTAVLGSYSDLLFRTQQNLVLVLATVQPVQPLPGRWACDKRAAAFGRLPRT